MVADPGMSMVLDANAKKRRTTIDVEKAAKLCVKEGPLRFAAFEGRPDRPYTGEEDLVVPTMPGDDEEAVS
jgi:hypothetical protein